MHLGGRGGRPDGRHHVGRPVGPGVHLRHDRPAQGRHDHPRPDVAHLCHLGPGGGPARRRPLPDRQPVLPHLRLQGRHPGLHHEGCDHVSRAGLRRGAGDAPDRLGEDHRPARPTDHLPVDPRPGRPQRGRPFESPPGGDRGRRDPRGVGGADVVGPQGRDGADRLRTDRGHRNGHHVPAGRFGRDHLGHFGSGHSRRRGPDRRCRRHGGAPRRIGRDCGAGLQRDEGLLQQPGGHRRDDRPRRLAPHRRHRRDGRRGEHRHHRPVEGHDRLRRVQRLPGRSGGRPAPTRIGRSGGRHRHPRRTDG